jgi:hypothetical protein
MRFFRIYPSRSRSEILDIGRLAPRLIIQVAPQAGFQDEDFAPLSPMLPGVAVEKAY